MQQNERMAGRLTRFPVSNREIVNGDLFVQDYCFRFFHCHLSLFRRRASRATLPGRGGLAVKRPVSVAQDTIPSEDKGASLFLTNHRKGYTPGGLIVNLYTG